MEQRPQVAADSRLSRTTTGGGTNGRRSKDDGSVELESVATQRLHNHRIALPGPDDAAQVAAWLGAVQAQDYSAAKWALGLRMPDSGTDADIERAFSSGRILRTHVLRPTWHFVAPADIHWMLTLTAPRVHRALAYANRYYELEVAVRNRAAGLFERALRGDRHLTRAELGSYLARAGIAAHGVRLALLTIHAELEAVVCSGAPRGAHQTYALVAKRAPVATRLSRDEALAELTKRYFRSHGPASIRDFTWWSGLTVADAKRGLGASGARSEAIGDHTYWAVESTTTSARDARVHLLPIYDEYLVAYRDQHAVPRGSAVRGALPQAVIARGQVAGTWKAARNGDEVIVKIKAEQPLTRAQRRALTTTGARYGRFLQATASIAIS